jgi:hypothetical protein
MGPSNADRAHKAAETRAKNAELAQKEAERLSKETVGKHNSTSHQARKLTSLIFDDRWTWCEAEST